MYFQNRDEAIHKYIATGTVILNFECPPLQGELLSRGLNKRQCLMVQKECYWAICNLAARSAGLLTIQRKGAL